VTDTRSAAVVDYEVTGVAGGPHLVQLGGAATGRHAFDGIRARFEATYSVISIDFRGYGACPAPDGGYGVEDRVEDVVAVLDDAGVDRAFVHGNSLGGMIALAFAIESPERTIAACVDSAYARADVVRRLMFETLSSMAETEAGVGWLTDLTLINSVGAPQALEGEAGAQLLAGHRHAVKATSSVTIAKAYAAMASVDLGAKSRRLRRPTLFINGELDRITPAYLGRSGHDAARIAGELPELATLRLLAGVGHGDLAEAPDAVHREVTEFFASVDARP
jgi:pimeloyl-ACP methyl ester carboxylesterase